MTAALPSRSGAAHVLAGTSLPARSRSLPMLDGIGDIPDWHVQAACRAEGVDPEVFFPAPGGAVKNRLAKAICQGCPVRQLCAGHALSVREPHGIWGGLAPKERAGLSDARGRCGA